MHVAFANSDLLSRLWLNRGLATLLREEALPPELSLLTGKEPGLGAGQVQRHEMQGRFPQRRAAPPPKQAPQTAPKPPKTVHVPHVSAVQSQPWPAIWQTLLGRVKQGHVVWTYRLLGSDLLQKQSPGLAERRAFLTRILKESPVYPQGTHTFWPYQLPEAAPCPELFWSGVSRLKAEAVMILGQEAGLALLGKTVVPYSQHHARGCHVVVFQDIQDLTQNLSLYGEMQKMLRDILGTIGLQPLA